ncbi:MAG: hypothetical protein MUO33_11835, partial [Sedimentisphaerales bacterium]|nr:hypothetical protein [Sedimentisphaerales bacterium]
MTFIVYPPTKAYKKSAGRPNAAPIVLAPGLLRQSDDQVIRRWVSEYQVSPVKGNIAFPDGPGLSCILVASFPDGLMDTRSEFYFQIGLTREQA